MSFVHFRIMLLAMGGLILFGAAPSAFALNFGYTVGGDAGCNFHTLNDAVAYTETHPGQNRINVARNMTYTAEAIVIDSQNLFIIGGFQNCTNLVFPTENTTIDGTGNGGNSVISIVGPSNVSLQNLTITGGSPGPSGHPGAFGGGISIDSISGGTVSLTSVDITNNTATFGGGINASNTNLTLTIDSSTISHNVSQSGGGGIDWAAGGVLTLTSSTVANNAAAVGGGIAVEPSFDGGTEFRIDGPNTFITGNTAQDSGGGISVGGNARLFMLTDGIFVAQNQAGTGNGGGLAIYGPARADIGSPGTGTGVINNNTAVNGGGISVDSSPNTGAAVLRLFSTDPARLVRITANAASAGGGGIYLKPYPTGQVPSGNATLCAHDFRIDSNVAVQGSAIYADSDINVGSAGDVLLEPTSADTESFGCDPEPPESLGAVACTLGSSCNMIDGNEAIDINNNDRPTDGATIFGDIGSHTVGDRLMLRGNSGGYALRMYAGNVDLRNCLFAENQLQHELILVASAQFFAQNCTFANDLIGATHTINDDHNVQFSNSIIDEPGTKSLLYTGPGAGIHVTDLLTNDTTDLPSDPSIIQGDPMFIDMAHGDYRLTATTIAHSPAIDFSAAVGGDDIAGNPRDKDVPSIANRFGAGDLGAYEMQPISDRIFADGYGDPVSLVY
jgi:hypothetical protein